MDIDVIINEFLNDKKVLNRKIVQRTGLNINLVQKLKKLSYSDRKEEIQRLRFEDLTKLKKYIMTYYCNNPSVKSTREEKFVAYCQNLVQDGSNKKYVIRLSKSLYRQIDDRKWEYCNIGKDSDVFGDNNKGAFDRKEFNIPVIEAENLLNINYIPFFYNPAD